MSCQVGYTAGTGLERHGQRQRLVQVQPARLQLALLDPQVGRESMTMIAAALSSQLSHRRRAVSSKERQ
jgi:hypothetical protein